jgi:NADPH:quinone reductase-like Zn-dependent oxidoreductase
MPTRKNVPQPHATTGRTGPDPRPTTMTAIVRERYGAADVLTVGDVETPAPADDEVLIRVHAAGVDRGAWHFMTGKPYLMRLAFGLRRPRNPRLGSELAGVVQAVGAGVTDWVTGDRVFGGSTGSFAEYALASPGKLARMPAGATFEQAAAVPVSGVTALQALRNQGRIQAGQTVLVIGASGGVGMFAVQIAKALGSGEVTGVCSTAKTEFVRSLGADHVIDYTAGDITRSGQRYDLVLDIGGNRPVRALRRLLTPTGTLVFVGGEGGGQLSGGLSRQVRSSVLSPFVGQRLGGMWVAGVNRADLETLAPMIESGAVIPAVDRVCTMAQIPEAMRDLAGGRVRGKIVVTI